MAEPKTKVKPKIEVKPKIDKYDTKRLCNIIDKYTDETDLPILKEVCYQNNLNYDTIMKYQRDREALMQSIKRLLYKKETELEKGGLTGKYQPTMTIFSLKQLGWQDRANDDDNEEEVKNATDILVKIRKTING